jgi:small subunit ribosomal protein S8
MMTDPIADMLTRIRNASSAKHKRVDMPVSKLKTEIARILKENHFIHDFKVLDDGRHGVLRVYLKYYEEQPVIRHVRARVAAGPAHVQGRDGAAAGAQRSGHRDRVDVAGVMTDRQARSREGRRRVMALVW